MKEALQEAGASPDLTNGELNMLLDGLDFFEKSVEDPATIVEELTIIMPIIFTEMNNNKLYLMLDDNMLTSVSVCGYLRWLAQLTWLALLRIW